MFNQHVCVNLSPDHSNSSGGSKWVSCETLHSDGRLNVILKPTWMYRPDDSRLSLWSQKIRTEMEAWQKVVGAENLEEKRRLSRRQRDKRGRTVRLERTKAGECIWASKAGRCIRERDWSWQGQQANENHQSYSLTAPTPPHPTPPPNQHLQLSFSLPLAVCFCPLSTSSVVISPAGGPKSGAVPATSQSGILVGCCDGRCDVNTDTDTLVCRGINRKSGLDE